ncbi:hypothetical protein ACSFA3_08010 [Variovorax sp. RHLX14]|uniref:hypothetical protein n=1 Tax=Variovorax sp. RHLX14 TaxID=1259731 RepID=UPI003F47C01F
MKTTPAIFNPVSRHPPSATTASSAGTGGTQFVRPARDRVPSPGFPDIDPNASEAENSLFSRINDFALGGSLPGIGIRLWQILMQEGNQETRQEEFTFRGKPASIKVTYPQVEISVGSNDDGSAGQISMMGGSVKSTQGNVMKDVKVREHVMKHAAFAIGLNIARQQNMPYAVAALQGSLNATALSNEHGKYIGS